MISRLRQNVLRHLSDQQVRRLRKLKGHVGGISDSLFRDQPVVNPTASTGLLISESLVGAGKAYDRVRDEVEREAILRAVMANVLQDRRFAAVLQDPYSDKLVASRDVLAYARAAASYGAGNVETAYETLAAQAAAAPTPFAHVCLARCASHGLDDDNRALALLETAFQAFPNDFSIALSLAFTHYRLNDTALANQHLEGIGPELASRLGVDGTGQKLQEELTHALERKLLVRPRSGTQDMYSEEYISGYWNHLWSEMVTNTRYQQRWAALSALAQQQLTEFLTKTAPDVRTLINFGVFCAKADFELATAFPDRSFIGVDRDILTKRLNDAAFSAPNLKFVANDIMAVLPQLKAHDGVTALFHSRTATLCYPEFVRTFYRRCYETGIDYIVLWENSCLSRATLRYHDFRDMPADSLPYWLVMFLHNYERFLTEAGYSIVEVRRKWSNVDLLEKPEFMGDGHVFIVAARSSNRRPSPPATLS